MRRFQRLIRVRPLGGLGAYSPADTTPRPSYVHQQQEAVALQSAAPPAGVAQPGVVVPPSSGAVYMPLPPWEVMPSDGEPIDPADVVALGAVATPVVVLSFRVPTGRDGVIYSFGNQDFGAGWTQGTGDLIWRILRDGFPVRNYENIRVSLGNIANPVKIGIRIYEGESIEVTAENTAIPGNPNVGARIHGWFYPKSHDQQGWA